MIPVPFLNIRNIGPPGRRISRRKRAAAAGMGVLMTSALALPVGMGAASAGDSHLDGAGAASAAKAHPSISVRLQAGLATLGPLGVTGALPRNRAPSSARGDHA